IGARLGDLQAEDRAFLSRFERLRIAVLREYDLGRLALVQNRLVRFFDDELRDGFLPLIRRRLDSPGLPPEKAAAYAVLGHVLPLWAELYAPIAPFTCEAIYRSFRGESESVFERPHTPILEPVLDPNAERAYDRWRSVTRALTRARRHLGVPARTLLERVVLFVRDEQAAVELRAAAETLGRIANVRLVEVASPNQPWEGKRVDAIPVLPAIQKVFGTGTPRVVRLLSGLPGRRVQEGIRSHSLEVAVEGRPVQIISSMVEFVESLPEGVVPIPWELGELFIQVPAGARTGEEGQAPPLTPDGFRFLRRVRHRLRRASDPASLSGIVVCAQGRLAEEVERQQTALTRYLRVPRLRVVAAADGFPPAETLVGRSGRGERWFVWVPGVSSPPPRRKEHRAHPEVGTGRRAPESEATVVDYLSPAVLEREHDLQEWVKRLDVALGRPIVGPSKLRYAWELGIRSYDDLTRAPYDQLAQLPGFGPYVAGEIVRSFGGVVPEHNRPVQSLVQYRSTVAGPANAPLTAGGPPVVVAGAPASATDPSLGPSTPEKPLETGPSPPPPPTAATESPVFVGGSGDSGRGAPSEVGEAGPAPGSPAESPALENPPDGSAFSPDGPAEKPDPATGVASAVSAELPTPEPSPLPYPEPPAPPDEAGAGSSGAVDSPSPSEADASVEPAANDSVPERVPVMEVTPPPAPAASDGVSAPDPASPSSLAEAPPSPPEPELDEQTPDHRGESHESEMAPPPPVGEETTAPSPASVDPEPAIPQDPTRPKPSESAVVAIGESPPEPAPPPPAPMSSMEPAIPVFDTSSREPPAELRTSEEPPAAPAPGPGAEDAVTISPSVEPQTLPSVEASPLASEVSPSTAPLVDVRVNEVSPPPPEFSAPPPLAEPRRVGTFVVAEPVNGPTWATFLDATAAGHRGLCLSREFPDRLRAMIGPRDVTVVWLSNAGRAGAARPGDLPGLRALIEGMVTKDGVTAIYIDSIEFLIRVNSIERVLDFLRGLHELATERMARLWVPVNPLLASAADVEQLTTAF
ncbi:MAG TPA: class I tRNA ligase family protein, partial [Thermoplasmata archaeon]|nr:class I tRNA ligase family protein [Thermoplasmata archaeon]